MARYFPYAQVRKIQDSFISRVEEALSDKENLIVHAPTGLGKTIGVLAPVVEYATEHGLTVFFLTSRHTQHRLAIDTLKDMKAAHEIRLEVSDVIGKRWMCPLVGTGKLYSAEFTEFCKKNREEGTCEYYSNCRTGSELSPKAKHLLSQLKGRILNTEQLIGLAGTDKLCPYEISLLHAAKANVIVADYYYIFHPKVSDSFLQRVRKDLERCIVIVDEAHNLPLRIRTLSSSKLTSVMIERALQEAGRYSYDQAIEYLNALEGSLKALSKGISIGQEKLVARDSFIQELSRVHDYKKIIEDLEATAKDVRDMQNKSQIGGVASFLSDWLGPEAGFARIIKSTPGKGKEMIVLSNNCLDPAVVSKPVIESLYCTIMMSGTLTPTVMYKDLIGFDNAGEATYDSPFPERNRLNLVVPYTTTKYSARSPEQFRRIAKVCSEITNRVPGNSLLFFPSYSIRDQVYAHFADDSEKTCFLEKPEYSASERDQMLARFGGYKDSGAVLLAVASGSFSEGIDLPGNLLRCVVIVGLPLQTPDLETKELIRYYDEKFGKGWDYGYIFPAFNKALQSAGRCIRSETDKGAIVFLDERYLWPNYRRLFPEDWDMVVSKDFALQIEDFFFQR